MLALAAPLLVLFPLGLGFLVWRRVSVLGHVSRRLTIMMALGGAVAAAVRRLLRAHRARRTPAYRWTWPRAARAARCLRPSCSRRRSRKPLKVSVVWPLYRTRRIVDSRLGVGYASAAGAGFSAVKGLMAVLLGTPRRCHRAAGVGQRARAALFCRRVGIRPRRAWPQAARALVLAGLAERDAAPRPVRSHRLGPRPRLARVGDSAVRVHGHRHLDRAARRRARVPRPPALDRSRSAFAARTARSAASGRSPADAALDRDRRVHHAWAW